VYKRIRSRQFEKVLSSDLAADRFSIINKVADDIVGMIERLRILPTPALPASRPVQARKEREFDSTAQSYERVDFLSDGEVVLGRPKADGWRDVLAHVGFVERLYIRGEQSRVEFGVRRAFVSVASNTSGVLSKLDELRDGNDQRNFRYVPWRDAPYAITICIDPPEGKLSLAELPLPPAPGENLFSRIATASAEVSVTQFHANLIVSLDVEGLYLVDDNYKLSAKKQAAIKAILGVARAKVARANNETVDRHGLFRRALPVSERS
jgi:hypothetical protein